MEAKINLTPETLCLWGPIAAGWQPGATEMESQSGQNKKENMKFFLLFLASEFNVWHGKRDATDTKHGSTEEIQQRSVINTGEVGQPINFGFSSAAGSPAIAIPTCQHWDDASPPCSQGRKRRWASKFRNSLVKGACWLVGSLPTISSNWFCHWATTCSMFVKWKI